MMHPPTCRTCPYWDRITESYSAQDREGRTPPPDLDPEEVMDWLIDDGLAVSCECVRFPPLLPSNAKFIDNQKGLYPLTVDSDWCGEHPQAKAYVEWFTSTHPESPEE
jgi:hypothetical protein